MFFSKNRPMADSFIALRCPSVCLCVCVPLFMRVFWGLSLALTQITWPDPSLSLVNPPRGRTGLITQRTGLITQRTGLITQRTGLITQRTGLITRIEPILLHAWSPSYYMRGALKTQVGAERPLPTHGAVAWTRQPPLFFFINHATSKKKFWS